MRHEQYPELRRLFACHLPEDMEDCYGTADAALEAGISGFRPDEFRAACEEMSRLREERMGQKPLTDLLHNALAVNYLWSVDGYTAEEWLAHVALMLERRLNSLPN